MTYLVRQIKAALHYLGQIEWLPNLPALAEVQLPVLCVLLLFVWLVFYRVCFPGVGGGSLAAVSVPKRRRNARMNGRPVTVVTKNEHTFELDEKALKSILLQNHVKDMHVVVISVAGAFRKGKSFLLDFFLRYLNAQGEPDWMGPEHSPLDGFSWRGGSERETTGILLWSEVFMRELPNGEKVALLLMDTQGAFDSDSTVKEYATIFALSTMLSSVQIYNLQHNIQEDDLQHLQLFTEYGRLALEDCNNKPFQKLQFLVRDWSFPYEAKYGAAGGRLILDRILQLSDRQHPELQSLRKHIRSCFEDISCFLMPHPGLKAATNPKFDGKLSDIETEFKRNLQDLVQMILAPEHLVIKKIGGQNVKAEELLQYFKSYIEIYKTDKLPRPKSILDATIEGNNLAAVATAKASYAAQMERVCGGTQPFLNSADLEAEHLRIKENIVQQFQSKKKMGGEERSQRYKDELLLDVEEMFKKFKFNNERKNTSYFKFSFKMSVSAAVAVIFCILSGFFGWTGMLSKVFLFIKNVVEEITSVRYLVMYALSLIYNTWTYISGRRTNQ